MPDETAEMMVYDITGPSTAWRALEQTLTGGEQMVSVIRKFYTKRQGPGPPRVLSAVRVHSV